MQCVVECKLGSWALALCAEDGDAWRGGEFWFMLEVWLLMYCGSGFSRWGFRCMMARELLESMDVPALFLITGLLA